MVKHKPCWKSPEVESCMSRRKNIQSSLKAAPHIKGVAVPLAAILSAMFSQACGRSTRDFSEPSEPTDEVTRDVCEKGALGCPCYKNLSCDQGVECSEGVCEEGSDPAPLQPTSSVVPDEEWATDSNDNGVATPSTPATPTASEASTSAGHWVLRSSCKSTSYDEQNRDNSLTDFDGVRTIYAYGDDTTSACLDDNTYPGTLCVEGNGTDSGADFALWGVGVGFQLAEVERVDGVWRAVAPWNAAERGIVALQFKASNLSGRALRVQLTEVNDPAISDPSLNYESNGFLSGGSAPKETIAGTNIIPLTEFELAEWTQERIASGLGVPLADSDIRIDPTRLHSLQFQAVNQPGDVVERYSFCISDVGWLDSEGYVVEPGESLPTAPSGSTVAPAAPTAGTASERSGGSADPGSSASSTASGNTSLCGETDECEGLSNGLQEGAIINFAVR